MAPGESVYHTVSPGAACVFSVSHVGAQLLERIFAVIHRAVGALEHAAEAVILAGQIIRKTQRGHGLAAADVPDHALIEALQQLRSALVIRALQNDGELVPADTEDGA